MNDVVLLSKYLSYILQRMNPKEFENKAIIDETNEKLTMLELQLTETNARAVLNALAAILAYPPHFWKDKKDYLTKVLKEFIEIGTVQTYLEVLNSLPAKFVRNDSDLYNPILKELTNSFTQFKKKFSTSDIVNVLERMAEFSYKNAQIYNLLFVEIAKHFNGFKKEEYFDIISAFTKMNIRQSDLYDKILTKVESFPFGFINNLKFILLNLIKVGHSSKETSDIILKIFNKLNPTRTQDILPFICYVPILQLPHQAAIDFLEKHINSLESKEIQFSLYHLLNLYNYLRYSHKDRPHLAEKIKSLVSGFEKEHKNFQTETEGKLKVKKLVMIS